MRTMENHIVTIVDYEFNNEGVIIWGYWDNQTELTGKGLFVASPFYLKSVQGMWMLIDQTHNVTYYTGWNGKLIPTS